MYVCASGEAQPFTSHALLLLLLLLLLLSPQA